MHLRLVLYACARYESFLFCTYLRSTYPPSAGMLSATMIHTQLPRLLRLPAVLSREVSGLMKRHPP